MMYYKMINDRMVLSDCRTIQTNEGVWISNPSAEQIADAGWLPYTPPIVPPQPQTEPDMEQMIEAVKKMLASSTEELSDEDALNVAALFPTWVSKLPEDPLNPGPTDTMPIGYRVWYDGKLYKAIQEHIPQRDWTPDATPALYVEVSIAEWPEIPENIPSTAPWMKGDKGTWKGQHYICKQDNCTWNPDQYPAAWELQS